MSTYRLEPIPHLPTQAIVLDSAIVGYLYEPKAAGDLWEIWPKFGCFDRLPDGDCGYAPRRFARQDGALAYLGLAAEAQAA